MSVAVGLRKPLSALPRPANQWQHEGSAAGVEATSGPSLVEQAPEDAVGSWPWFLCWGLCAQLLIDTPGEKNGAVSCLSHVPAKGCSSMALARRIVSTCCLPACVWVASCGWSEDLVLQCAAARAPVCFAPCLGSLGCYNGICLGS